MRPRLASRFDVLERRTRNLLSQLAALEPEQLAFRPRPDAWSLLGVADHLARSEREVVRSLEKGLPEGLSRRRLRHRLAYRAVMGVMASPLKVKAPIPTIVPQGDRPLEEIEAEWGEARRRLGEGLEAIPEAELDRPVMAHPVAGPLPPAQTLDFLDAHLRHHLRQVDRLRAHPDFPTAD